MICRGQAVTGIGASGFLDPIELRSRPGAKLFSASAQSKPRAPSRPGGIDSSLLEWPRRAITVNLAPAALRKEGTGFDLAIALTVLAASAQIPSERLEVHEVIRR